MAKRDPNHLTPSGDGRWCKRVRGVLTHFGEIGGTFDQALADWLRVKDDLLAGRPVRRVPTGPRSDLTLKHVVDAFLSAWGDKVKDGSLKGTTFDDYYRALDEFGGALGFGRDPRTLTPEDFRAVRVMWAKRLGPWAIDRNVQAVRTMFRWAMKVPRLIDREPWYGDQFSKSTEGQKRIAAREKARQRGERRFSVDELAVILAEAVAPLRAMVLLGLNGGMYATDIARLRKSDIVQEEGQWVVDFDRAKTGGVLWKFPLWPETREAIGDALALNRQPRDPRHADLVFLTVRGNPWHRENVRVDETGGIAAVSETHGIGQEFDKILDADRVRETGEAWKLRRAGVGFGSLRHTHTTATGDHDDKRAARRVRGHKIVEIERHYDAIPIERLTAVTDLARDRLLLPALAAALRNREARPPAPIDAPAPTGSARQRRGDAGAA